MSSITENFLMTFLFFVVIDLFRLLSVAFLHRGAKTHGQQRGVFEFAIIQFNDCGYGGSKTLNFEKFTLLSLFFFPPRGAKLHCCQLLWGPWPDWPPWICHCRPRLLKLEAKFLNQSATTIHRCKKNDFYVFFIF